MTAWEVVGWCFILLCYICFAIVVMKVLYELAFGIPEKLERIAGLLDDGLFDDDAENKSNE